MRRQFIRVQFSDSNTVSKPVPSMAPKTWPFLHAEGIEDMEIIYLVIFRRTLNSSRCTTSEQPRKEEYRGPMKTRVADLDFFEILLQSPDFKFSPD